MTLKNRFEDFARLYTWTHFIIGSAAFLTVATIFDFYAQRAGGRAGAKFMTAAIFSLEALGIGLAIGLAFAGVRRLIQGHGDFTQIRETALWIACVFGIACIAARMLS